MNSHFPKIFLVFVLILVGLFLIYPTVNAALVPCGRSSCDKWDSAGTKCLVPTPPEEMKPCTTCDLFALASRIINFVLFTVVPAVAVLFYLIGGLMILLAGARPGLISTGKNFFWNTTWGLVIIFGAWMITNTVLKSLVGDKDISNNWYKIECTSVVQQPPATVTKYACNSLKQCVANSSGRYSNSTCDDDCTAATPGTLACVYNGVNYSTFNLCSGQRRPGGCGTSSCSQYRDSIKKYANGAATVDVLKTFMVVESDCGTNVNSGSSYGLMQLQPGTAKMVAQYCNLNLPPGQLIDSTWLLNPNNYDKEVCLAAYYISVTLAQGNCGSQPRNLYAGYNAGPGNCKASSFCTSQDCSGDPIKAWECPYNDSQHTTCDGLGETRQGATYVNYCLNNLGF